MRTDVHFNLVRAIETFVAVAETRQMTRAARTLGITQSAASQHLRNLEKTLGSPLLDRSKRPMRLTQAGLVLYRRASRILNEVEDLRWEIRRLGSGPLPLLRVAMLSSIATTLMPRLIELAVDRYKIPEVSIFAGIASNNATLLRDRRVDLAVTSDPMFDMDGLSRFPMLRERFVLILPKDYDKPISDLGKLANTLPLIRYSPETLVGRRIDQHLRRARLELPRSVEADRTGMVIATVAMGRGFSIVTPTLLIDAVMSGMAFDIRRLPIPAFTRDITLVGRKDELGDLPTVFANTFADSLIDQILVNIPDLPPDSLRPIYGGP